MPAHSLVVGKVRFGVPWLADWVLVSDREVDTIESTEDGRGCDLGVYFDPCSGELNFRALVRFSDRPLSMLICTDPMGSMAHL